MLQNKKKYVSYNTSLIKFTNTARQNCGMYEVRTISPVLGSDVRVNVLIEEFKHQRYTICKHQVLTHVLELNQLQNDI